MSKILDLMPKIAATLPRDRWTKYVPEHATLLELCNQNSVSTLGVSNSTGGEMILAYFIDAGEQWINVYQKGMGINSSHLFFWMVATKALDGEVLMPDNIVELAGTVIGDDWVIEE